MKALLNRRTIIIFSTALLLAIVSIVSVNVFSSSGPVTGVANAITTPVRALATTVARTYSRIFSAMYEYDELVARNDELTRRLAEMEIDTREAQLLSEENSRLRSLLEFRQRYASYDTEQARVDSWTSDNWSSTFIINKGYSNSSSEISRGMGVVTAEGILIGQLHDIGATRSTVITIIDTRFSAAVFVGRRDVSDDPGTSAVGRGDFSYMGSGMLVLDNIDDSIIVRKGDMVVTAGGSVFPARLIVGEVFSVDRNPSGIGRLALVEPFVNYDTLSDVFIITGFEEAE